jgi:hypothetical protein
MCPGTIAFCLEIDTSLDLRTSLFSTALNTAETDTPPIDEYGSTPLAHQSSLPSNSPNARVKLSHMARPTLSPGTFHHPAINYPQ